MAIRVSFCCNAGPRAGVAHSAVLVADLSTEALIATASNKLRLKKKDVVVARLFLWCKDARSGTELPRHGTCTSIRNGDVIAISLGEPYGGPKANSCVLDESSAQLIADPSLVLSATIPPLIAGTDDAGNSYPCLEALWHEQAKMQKDYYVANDRWWDSDGYGGASDEEAMIGDSGSEEDIRHSLAFLDALRARRPTMILRAALDAGAGVGRVTKHVLLRRCDHVCLVEPCERWHKQSRRYLGNKRAGACAFVCSRLEELSMASGPRTSGSSPEQQQYDLVWIQWTLQYLIDAHVVSALRVLASYLTTEGVLVLKENLPCPKTGSGATTSNAFRVDTPEGPHERYDVTRPDEHHMWLFECAGLEVEHKETGCVNGEVTAWVLIPKGGSGSTRLRQPNEWRRPHRAQPGEDEQMGTAALLQPSLDIEEMAKVMSDRMLALAL